jgi:hypothetical protein
VKLPISCFIITKNEADRIVPTIRSVSDMDAASSSPCRSAIARARLRGTRGFYHPGFPMTTDHRARS